MYRILFSGGNADPRGVHKAKYIIRNPNRKFRVPIATVAVVASDAMTAQKKVLTVGQRHSSAGGFRSGAPLEYLRFVVHSVGRWPCTRRPSAAAGGGLAEWSTAS